MIKRYNNLSFLFFILGIIAQIAGFGFYAKAKGRSPAWGLAGFIGLPGLLLLAVLKDRSGDPWNT